MHLHLLLSRSSLTMQDAMFASGEVIMRTDAAFDQADAIPIRLGIVCMTKRPVFLETWLLRDAFLPAHRGCAQHV